MVMVERLVRIFLNEKDSYFFCQLFSTVMSGTTTNDMKHRFGHVVPKDAIIILSVLGSGRECPSCSRTTQEWGGAARGDVRVVEGRGGGGKVHVRGKEHVDNITSENILPFKSVKWHS